MRGIKRKASITSSIRNLKPKHPYSFRVTLQKVFIDIPAVGSGLTLDCQWNPVAIRIKMIIGGRSIYLLEDSSTVYFTKKGQDIPPFFSQYGLISFDRRWVAKVRAESLNDPNSGLFLEIDYEIALPNEAGTVSLTVTGEIPLADMFQKWLAEENQKIARAMVKHKVDETDKKFMKGVKYKGKTTVN